MQPTLITETGTTFQGDATYLGDRPDSELTTGEKTIVREITVQWPSAPAVPDLIAFEKQYPPHLFIAEHISSSPRRYWRLFMPYGGAESVNVLFADVQMRDEIGGADIATTGFAIMGSVPGQNPEPAFDTDPDSYVWLASAYDHDEFWVGQDFGDGNEKEIVEVAISTDGAYPEYGPGAFDVQYSDDGATWTTSWSVAGEPAWSAYETRVYTKP